MQWSLNIVGIQSEDGIGKSNLEFTIWPEIAMVAFAVLEALVHHTERNIANLEAIAMSAASQNIG
jgi:hypothetical protein